ncbi:lipid A biosynthesis acyltransferase [Bizionia paragorgiae]|uniref:Predicted acyltransferase, LPLAT superfamily n=1 Tax=Bizionia paragorgiae TaxID=283786 RepID=A0A1H4CC86_BIZPA|nr:lipid A biosynthesis acyltransferase [Bizionia paragorgiae]MDX1271874.1 lipid A biosynthesis acyltransferase [Bizionia paragorgiae]SEA58011.1 Predicted acyltransferase, LPLAT superfamily [Bizionia paragorgiae]
MAAEWDGKSRGTVFGFKVFIFFIKNFGINAAYALMHLPVPYFCLFSRKNVRGLYYYFNKRLKYSWFKSSVSIYKTYFVFGQTLIDKVAISAGLRKNYTYEFDGEHLIEDVLALKKGGILISAHIGNFELAQFFFRERLADQSISIVITDQDHQEIKEYLDQFLKKSEMNFIVVKDDMSHIFEINAALAQNRIICISGDRYLENNKCMEEELLGKTAKFPMGPFLLGSRLKVPVLFVYVLREPKKHYHLYARRVEVKARDAQDLLKKYTTTLESFIKKYPLQWFNFYDFWDDVK